ncbi:MAG: hypothetical protein J2O48_09245 [Solirubrobacterales bacterium]|nr:hypothetical protein [Solirubrobacterales bacterium]
MAKRKKGVDDAGPVVASESEAEAGALLKRLVDDDGLRAAVSDLLDAATGAESVDETPGKKKKGKLRKLIVLAGLGGGGALAASEDLRSKLLDALFGSEEEFQYTPADSAGTGSQAGDTPPAA